MLATKIGDAPACRMRVLAGSVATSTPIIAPPGNDTGPVLFQTKTAPIGSPCGLPTISMLCGPLPAKATVLWPACSHASPSTKSPCRTWECAPAT